MAATADRRPPRWAMRAQWRAHRWLWDVSGGRVGGRLGRLRFLELVTTGHASGQPRHVLLSWFPHPDGWVVVASNAGSDRPPAWYRNLRAHPRVRVREAGRWHDAVAEDLAGDEREAAWRLAASRFPDYDRYARATEREIPVVLLRRRDPVDATPGSVDS